MHCTQCGAKNQDAARFCGSCGAALAAAEAGVLVTKSNSPALVGALIVVVVLLLMVLTVGATLWLHNRQVDRAREAASVAAEQAQSAPRSPSSPAPAAPRPVPAEDPVAEAQVVLENYLAADLGHDGQAMKQYLGGQAAARFVAEAQGQEDLTVQSQKVSGHTVKDDNTIVFSVAVQWSSAGSSEVKTQTDRYVVKRTDAGWRITSTPAYPE